MGTPGTLEEDPEWDRVDRGLAQARKLLERASSEEQFQPVGLLCREVVISLAQAVYDPSVHQCSDEDIPSQTDAKRMLGAFLKVELPGHSGQRQRKTANSTLDQTSELVHKRTATQRDAELCVVATENLVRQIRTISGRASQRADEGVLALFSYETVSCSQREHVYLLVVVVTNQSGCKIDDFRLEFRFPDLDTIPMMWEILPPDAQRSQGALVEIVGKDDAVESVRGGYVVRVAYRSTTALFPEQTVNLRSVLELTYRINQDVYENMHSIPPLRWVLYADDLPPRRGEVSLNDLNCF